MATRATVRSLEPQCEPASSRAGRGPMSSSRDVDESSALAPDALPVMVSVPNAGTYQVPLAGGRVVVMSIHPRYAIQILKGTKQVEFRKRPLADDVTHVVVYATAPISAVVGAFAVSGQLTLNPRTLWRRFRAVGGIAWRDFIAYYDGRCVGTGIEIGQVLRADAPMNLFDHFRISHPPQSFQYLSAEAAGPVLNTMTPI